MADLVVRRFVALVGVLFGLAVIVFLLQAEIPADPVRAMVGASAPPEIVAAKRHQLGYDKPLPIRFFDYMGRLASGNLQTSLRTRERCREWRRLESRLALQGRRLRRFRRLSELRFASASRAEQRAGWMRARLRLRHHWR